MSVWFTEEDGQGRRYGFAIEDVLFSGQSAYQKVEVFQTKHWGRLLAVDGFVMLTERDEFVYHEMISHPAVCMHQSPEEVVVIGGGDGGTLRELVKHDAVKHITLCEIDQMVIDASLEFLPGVASAFEHDKVTVKVGDGIAYMNELENHADLILVDSADPIGPGEGLFTDVFYRSVAKALKPDGLMVAQTDSVWMNQVQQQKVYGQISSAFREVKPMQGVVPTYPNAHWTWTMAANRPLDLSQLDLSRLAAVEKDLQYLNQDMLKAVFALPTFYRRQLGLS
ncbi:MAG: polyamine aminopropyltransferase [Oligoflexales bacterium]